MQYHIGLRYLLRKQRSAVLRSEGGKVIKQKSSLPQGQWFSFGKSKTVLHVIELDSAPGYLMNE